MAHSVTYHRHQMLRAISTGLLPCKALLQGVVGPLSIFTLTFITVVFLSTSVTVAADDDRYLRIIHLNVGQGDATLVIGPDGTTVLIDAGEPKYAKSSIKPALTTLGVSRLDYIIATHFHRDHIGGFEHLGDFTDASTVIYDRGDCVGEAGCFAPPKLTTPSGRSTTYGKYLTALKGSYKRVGMDTPTISLGAGATIRFVAAGGAVWGETVSTAGSDDENAQSVALVITHGGFSYFIGGDLTGGGNSKRDVESVVASLVGNVDVYQSNHHGSPTSNNQLFLEALRPEVVVISVGDGNSHHLPKRSVLNRFRALMDTHGLKRVFMTNDGNIGGVGPNHEGAGLLDSDKEFITVATQHVTLFAAPDHYIINGMILPTD